MLELTTRRHLLSVAVVLLFILAPSLVRAIAGSHRPGLLGQIVFFVFVVALVPLVMTACLRWGERHRWSIGWTIVAAYGLSMVTGAALADGWLAIDALGLEPIAGDYVATTAAGAYMGAAMGGVWGMFAMLPRALRQARERAELRREVERARVRAALEPHFVLNTLNAISGLISTNHELARDLVGDLGDLLRDVVSLADQTNQPVADEIAWLQRYARILEARHRDRLAVEWDVAPDVAALSIPVLVLQPLLENAIRHGALHRPTGGRVRVTVARAAGSLRCTIEDNGPGLADPEPGHGLELLRRRLACDAPGSRLDLQSTAAGTRATIELGVA